MGFDINQHKGYPLDYFIFYFLEKIHVDSETMYQFWSTKFMDAYFGLALGGWTPKGVWIYPDDTKKNLLMSVIHSPTLPTILAQGGCQKS